MASYLYVFLGIHLLYPLRLLCRHRDSGTRIKLYSPLRGILDSFDHASLLYPTLLPIFVAISLYPFNPKVVLANLMLSVAAVPHQIIPFACLGSAFDMLHWFLSAVPLIIVRRSRPIVGDHVIPDQSDAEKFSLIYPLHQALLSTIGSLTTTSLLPAELQLLSISMVDLLLFSTSAQAVILKALLWVGGFLMFILCGNVLQWGVALARIPRWRFRQPSRASRERHVLLVALDDYFQGRLSKWRLIAAGYESSDSDSCLFAGTETPQKARLERPRLEIRRKKGAMHDLGLKRPISAIDRKAHDDFVGSEDPADPSAVQRRRSRRHTLLSYVESSGCDPLLQKRALHPLSRPSQPSRRRSRSFLSMTHAQATVLKWSYSVYVYLVTLFIIAVPVRLTISRWALNGHEPVGWALGYLFGDLPIFRSMTLNMHLESWICLPSIPELRHSWVNSTWSEALYGLGAANTRLFICLHCLSVLAVGLGLLIALTPFVEVDTRRKVFHGMMVVMFLPSIIVDPPFAAFALSLALAVFLLLDLFRASQLPPLSRPLTHFLAPYVDGRDHRGPIIVSHIFLLIGCAIPLWLSLAAVDRVGRPPWHGWEVSTRDLSMVSGVICVGMGDAAASLFGRRFGRRRWIWGGGKSLEGSFAFVVAVMLGLLLGKLGIQMGGWDTDSSTKDDWMMALPKMTVAALGASLTEAVLTGGNDNVIVPVVLWLLVRGLAI